MKAIGLVSGGLDSSIAVALLCSQGIEVIAVHFVSPFFGGREFLRGVMERLGARFQEVYLGEECLEIVRSPRFGYGKNLNPCIDCKVLMLRKAKALMEEEGAGFVFTGEVLGQRPKSQMRETLRLIEKESGLSGLLLRPLSAKFLPPTMPELEGWVRREELLGIAGRGRKEQFALAERFGIEEYTSPAGGCLLTDPLFCRRLSDLIRYGPFTLEEVELLKVGRHFRLAPSYKLIVGRNESENRVLLQKAREEDIIFFPQGGKGPVGLGRGTKDLELLAISARIIAFYTKNGKDRTGVVVRGAPCGSYILEAPKCSEEDLESWRILGR